jgi:hypothetical protein
MLAAVAKRIDFKATQTIMEFNNRKTAGSGKDPHYKRQVKDPVSQMSGH